MVYLSLVGTFRGENAELRRRTGERKGAACGVPFTLAGTRATVRQKRPRKGRRENATGADEQEHTGQRRYAGATLKPGTAGR